MIYGSVAVVLAHRVPELWAQCKPLIQSAISTSPIRSDIEQIFDQLVQGKLELLVGFDHAAAVQAVLVVRYRPEADGFVAHIQAAAGRGVSLAREEWGDVLRWLESKKVRRVQLHCQGPQERLRFAWHKHLPDSLPSWAPCVPTTRPGRRPCRTGSFGFNPTAMRAIRDPS